MLASAMNLLFAHVTGVPHHPEDLSTMVRLWPLFLLALELIVYIVKFRAKLGWAFVCRFFGYKSQST